MLYFFLEKTTINNIIYTETKAELQLKHTMILELIENHLDVEASLSSCASSITEDDNKKIRQNLSEDHHINTINSTGVTKSLSKCFGHLRRQNFFTQWLEIKLEYRPPIALRYCEQGPQDWQHIAIFDWALLSVPKTIYAYTRLIFFAIECRRQPYYHWFFL